MLDVWDGDASAEACGAAAFAVEDFGDEFIAQGFVADARGDESVDEFVDDAIAVCGLEGGDDRALWDISLSFITIGSPRARWARQCFCLTWSFQSRNWRSPFSTTRSMAA